jgi:FkbM family methyltransferase
MLLKSFLKNAFSLLQGSSVYQMGAAYNVNSNIGKKKHIIDKLLENNKINVMDIGCRGGGSPELFFLYKHINLIGFDADKDEVDNLNGNKELASQFNRAAFYNYALDAEEGIKTLYLTRSLGSSSLYRPSSKYKSLFSRSELDVMSEIQLKTEKLDVVVAKEMIKDIDFIKLDTQGTELNILKGAEKSLLPNLLMVESEVEFQEMYENQPLFPELDIFLREHNFTLFYLNRVYEKISTLNSNKYAYSKGLLTFGDVLYVKSISASQDFTSEKIVKFIVLLANYGYYDYAREVFKLNESKLSEYAPLLKQLLQVNNSKLSFILGFVFAFIVDWLVFFLLKLRGWNYQGSDSDRSYPIQ